MPHMIHVSKRERDTLTAYTQRVSESERKKKDIINRQTDMGEKENDNPLIKPDV